jgi:hypothetical protein
MPTVRFLPEPADMTVSVCSSALPSKSGRVRDVRCGSAERRRRRRSEATLQAVAATCSANVNSNEDFSEAFANRALFRWPQSTIEEKGPNDRGTATGASCRVLSFGFPFPETGRELTVAVQAPHRMTRCSRLSNGITSCPWTGGRRGNACQKSIKRHLVLQLPATDNLVQAEAQLRAL